MLWEFNAVNDTFLLEIPWLRTETMVLRTMRNRELQMNAVSQARFADVEVYGYGAWLPTENNLTLLGQLGGM